MQRSKQMQGMHFTGNSDAYGQGLHQESDGCCSSIAEHELGAPLVNMQPMGWTRLD